MAKNTKFLSDFRRATAAAKKKKVSRPVRAAKAKGTHANGAKSRAVLTIRNAGKMSPLGRKQIADWLRMHAAMLTKDGANYAGGFQGRYLSVGR